MNFEKNTIKNPEITQKDSFAKKIGEIELTTEISQEKIEKEILSIIEIIKPDDMSLGEYEQHATEDLFDSVKKQQVSKGILIQNPEKTNEEIKDLLISRLKSVLEDARDYNLKTKLDEELVKKAKIALLFEGDMSDANKSSYLSEGKIPKIQELRDYIVGYGEKNKLTESDIDSLMRTKYRKSLTSVMNDHMYYIGSYGTMDKIPKSLMIGLVQAEEENPNYNHYYPIKGGLETAEIGKYDNDCLYQLLASDYTRLCLKNVDKFKGKPIEKILKSGNFHGDGDSLEYLKKLDLPKEDFDKYLDIIIKHNICHELRRNFGKFYNKEREVVSVYQDTIEKLHNIEMDVNYKNDSQNAIEIKDTIENGYIGLALATYVCKNYIKKYAEDDYENFKREINKYDQEHLVFEYLKDEDKIEYAHKLIEQGEEYQIVKLHKLFKEHSLSPEIFSKIKSKDLIYSLKGDLSQFKELSQEEAIDFIDRERVNIFINNINSFNISDIFLKDKKVQEACFAEFNKEIMSFSPKKARIISEKIPFNKEELDQAILKAVKYKWLEAGGGRSDWARSVIYQFPEIKKYLDNSEDKERAFNDLKRELDTGCAVYAAEILECFLIPREWLENSDIIKNTIKSIQKNYLTANNNEGNFLENFEKSFSVARRIAEFINLPDFIINEIEITINEISKLETNPPGIQKELVKKIIVSEKPRETYTQILKLLDEIEAVKEISLDKVWVLLYIDNFLDQGTKEDKKEFFEKIIKDVDVVVQNKTPDFSANKSYYKFILNQVYPKRNYDTYQYIDNYKDRSEDLDSFQFDRDGYAMRLSGVVGYKIKDGFEKNPDILNKYQNRIKAIGDLAQNHENILNIINKNLPDTKSKTLEGKLFEFIYQNKTDMQTVDLLLAYQLSGQYDQFIQQSADRTEMYEKMEGKEYVMLAELSERYGDLMKETLKEIAKKIKESEDAQLFTKDNSKDIAKGEKVSIDILAELSKIPKENLTTDKIRKKIIKSLINTYQQIPSIKTLAEMFANDFSKENFWEFQNIFNKNIKKMFDSINLEIITGVQRIEPLRQKAYEEIKKELDKYDEIKEIDTDRKGEEKMSKERLIKGYFSKNRENAHARMVADVCLASNYKMLENKKYLEFVLFDEERKKCNGTVMLLEMNEPNDKRYLLYCPNPSVDLVSQVSAEKLYGLITSNIITFAKQNNFDGVLVDKRHGHSTNRSGLFQTSLEKSILRNETGGEIVFNLENSHELSNSYTYQKDLNAVWLK